MMEVIHTYVALLEYHNTPGQMILAPLLNGSWVDEQKHLYLPQASWLCNLNDHNT